MGIRLKQHRFLFEELVKRDFKKKYKGTVLGMLWSVLSPLATLLIMRIVFTHFFGAGIPHFTIYLFCGNVIFAYFSEATTAGMRAVVDNSGILLKVNVPKWLFLLAKNVQTLINFGLTFVLLLLFCVLDGIRFTWAFLSLAYPILMLLLFNVGVGLILSALYVFFRDMLYLWGVFTTMLMYVSAIFYDVSTFPAPAQKLFLLNPVYVFIRYFRTVLIAGSVPSAGIHLLLAGYALLALGVGALVYRKESSNFVYYL